MQVLDVACHAGLVAIRRCACAAYTQAKPIVKVGGHSKVRESVFVFNPCEFGLVRDQKC
jgi:hypothetical protein